MSITIRAIYDGEVLRPVGAIELETNAEYRVTVEPLAQGEADYPLTVLADMAVDMGVTDLAERHDFYARRRAGEEDEVAE